MPAIVAGPGVRHGTEDTPISVDSVLATVVEWSGMTPPSGVGPSFAPCAVSAAECADTLVATQLWRPNGTPFPPVNGELAVRNERYKVRATIPRRVEMFDLWTDPWEQMALGRSANPANWDELVDELRRIRDEWVFP